MVFFANQLPDRSWSMSCKYVYRFGLAKPASCESEQCQRWVTVSGTVFQRVTSEAVKLFFFLVLEPWSELLQGRHRSVKLSCQIPGVDGNHGIVLLSSLHLCDEVQWFYTSCWFQPAEQCHAWALLHSLRPAKYSSFPFLTTCPTNRSCLVITVTTVVRKT